MSDNRRHQSSDESGLPQPPEIRYVGISPQSSVQSKDAKQHQLCGHQNACQEWNLFKVKWAENKFKSQQVSPDARHGENGSIADKHHVKLCLFKLSNHGSIFRLLLSNLLCLRSAAGSLYKTEPPAKVRSTKMAVTDNYRELDHLTCNRLSPSIAQARGYRGASRCKQDVIYVQQTPEALFHLHELFPWTAIAPLPNSPGKAHRMP